MRPSLDRWTPLLRGASYALLGFAAGSLMATWVSPTLAAVIVGVGVLLIVGYLEWDRRRFMARMRADAATWNRALDLLKETSQPGKDPDPGS